MREDLARPRRRARPRARSVDPELVNRLFRSAHSLKGLAGMFGFDGDQRARRTTSRTCSTGCASAAPQLDDAGARRCSTTRCALIGAALEKLEDGDGAPASTSEAAAPDRAHRRLDARRRRREAATGGELELDPSLLRALTEYEEHRLRENLAPRPPHPRGRGELRHPARSRRGSPS